MRSIGASLTIPNEVTNDWQKITNLLARIVDVPTALVMRYTTPEIEVFVSSRSDENPYKPGDKEELLGSGLYCERVITTQSMLHVPDALRDPDWKNNPDIKFNMISYLGFPILLPDKQPFGTICVLDRKANDYSDVFIELIKRMKSQIETQLELLYVNTALGSQNRRLVDYLDEIQALRGIIPVCTHCKSIRDPEGTWRPIDHYLSRNPEADFSHTVCDSCMANLYPEYAE